MMTRNTSAFIEVSKKLALIPLFVVAIACFTFKVSAQAPVKPKIDIYQLPSTADGVSKELLSEYEAILDKYVSDGKQWWKGFDSLILDDRRRLEEIFMQMSKHQKDKQFVAFRKYGDPLPYTVPTSGLLKAWQDDKVYGVWIDNKCVRNAQLVNYDRTDFSQVTVSKLSKVAVNYGKHYYQVELMTNDHYEEYLASRKSVTGNAIMFRGFLFKNRSQN